MVMARRPGGVLDWRGRSHAGSLDPGGHRSGVPPAVAYWTHLRATSPAVDGLDPLGAGVRVSSLRGAAGDGRHRGHARPPVAHSPTPPGMDSGGPLQPRAR